MERAMTRLASRIALIALVAAMALAGCGMQAWSRSGRSLLDTAP
jgi:hypothetical protein